MWWENGKIVYYTANHIKLHYAYHLINIVTVCVLSGDYINTQKLMFVK